MRKSTWIGLLIAAGTLALRAGAAHAQTVVPPAPPTQPSLGFPLPNLSNPQTISSALQLLVLLTVLSLAPAIIIMVTGFTRIVIVLSLLRQALGTQQLPPNQILIGLAMFMTFLVNGRMFQRVYDEAVDPYLNHGMASNVAIDAAARPVREFMILQIDRYENWDNVEMFQEFAGKEPPKRWGDVSTFTLIPAFMLGELKTAFLMGFTIYLPFLVIDMVISTVLISMGMMMLPPALISLPFKLLMFVLVDGWHLIVQNLVGSFRET